MKYDWLLEIVVILGFSWRYLGHVVEKILVGLVLVHELEHEVHRLCRIHLGKQLAKYPYSLALILGVEEVVAASS